MTEIGGHFGVHHMTGIRTVRKFEDRKKCCYVRLTPCFFQVPLAAFFMGVYFMLNL